MKRFLYFLLITALIILLLIMPAPCIAYAGNGLLLWFHKLLPTLFPFMILSGIMVRMRLTSYFPSAGVYGIVTGFFCGFPMGALTASSLYEEKQISAREAEYLCAFTNNMGPVYFCSYVLPTLGITRKLPCIIGMYGIPLLYGLFLRRTSYRDCRFPKLRREKAPDLFTAVDASVNQAIASITRLGGYLILLQTLYVLPELFCRLSARVFPANQEFWQFLRSYLCCFLEITGAIGKMSGYPAFFVLTLLPLGGLSFLLQTGAILRRSGLSFSKYLYHKLIQTVLTVFFYGIGIAAGF